MKKALGIIFIVILSLSLVTTGVILAFPKQVQAVLDSVTGGFSSITQTATQPPTESTIAPTQPIQPKLTVKADSTTVEVGDTISLNAKETAGAKDNNIRYDTKDKNIASIDANGTVTGMSMGECDVWAYVDGHNDTKQTVKITVTDKRIEQITPLVEYLNTLPLTEKYTYATTKNGNARLAQCKIDDFNKDDNYKMFVKYNLTENLNKAEFVLQSYGTATSYKTAVSYTNIANGGYTSYEENIYTDSDGTPFIIAESSKENGNLIQTTTVRYEINGTSLEAKETLTASKSKDANDKKAKSTFKKDSKTITQSEYITELSSIKSRGTLQENFVDMIGNVDQGKSIKAPLPVELGEAYNNRITWKTDNKDIATVNSGGVITGEKAGECTITGNMPIFTGSICNIAVNVKGVEDEYTAYIRKEKDNTITGENGVTLKLYAYQVMDIDGDNKREMFMYYTGNNTCQIDTVSISGSSVTRNVALNEATESGEVLTLDFYTNLSSKETMLCEKYNHENSSTVKFYYDTYSGDEFVKASSEYKVEKESNGSTKFYMGSEEVEESVFSGSLARFKAAGEWTKVES